jgi:two-component sensor histidine kinase/CheY-like chemotaxis protein
MMPDSLTQIRVLYIDDDPATTRLVQRHLERAGYAVVTAGSADEGLALAAANGFDAIALDHYMPGRDGLEALAELRALPEAPPVIFVTAAEEPRIAVSALKEGAADYVVKDVHGAFLPALATAIRRALEQDRLQRAKEAAEREVRESRDRLERLAAQQAVLLREVNHRVANSLQLISALIDLQARKVSDAAAREMLRQAAKRVEAVSLVHRRLYTSNDVAFVDLDQYLAGLIDELRMSMAESGHRIVLESEPIRMETDKAVPLGLIVNELVTNALKYAYTPGSSGTVRVDFRRDGDGVVELAVADDGIGYPEQADVAPRGSGLGALIVDAMARSLGAEISRDPDHKGTRFVLRLTV